MPCGGCGKSSRVEPGRTAWGPQVQWESEEGCALLCSVNAWGPGACEDSFLSAPQQSLLQLPSMFDADGWLPPPGIPRP